VKQLTKIFDVDSALSKRMVLLLGTIAGTIYFLSWPDYDLYPLALLQ